MIYNQIRIRGTDLTKEHLEYKPFLPGYNSSISRIENTETYHLPFPSGKVNLEEALRVCQFVEYVWVGFNLTKQEIKEQILTQPLFQDAKLLYEEVNKNNYLIENECLSCGSTVGFSSEKYNIICSFCKSRTDNIKGGDEK